MKKVIKDQDFLNFHLVMCRSKLMSQLPEEIKVYIQSFLFYFQCEKGCKAFLFKSAGLFWGCKCTIQIYDDDKEDFEKITLEDALRNSINWN